MTAIEKIKFDITRLTLKERVELVDELLSDLAEPDAALEAGWSAEAAERLAAYDRGEIKGVSLDELLARRKG
jgi:putative addiction module component (TIGR02574 family)